MNKSIKILKMESRIIHNNISQEIVSNLVSKVEFISLKTISKKLRYSASENKFFIANKVKLFEEEKSLASVCKSFNKVIDIIQSKITLNDFFEMREDTDLEKKLVEDNIDIRAITLSDLRKNKDNIYTKLCGSLNKITKKTFFNVPKHEYILSMLMGRNIELNIPHVSASTILLFLKNNDRKSIYKYMKFMI